MNPAPVFRFDNSFAHLGETFSHSQPPQPASKPELVALNTRLAQELGADIPALQSPQTIAALAGNGLLVGSEPVATVYAGHQFGSWNPQLGDGRALLLGEVLSPDGQRFDLQLKGSGPTPYSRGGDGRSPLGPVLREYLLSEAMAALGIPTTRALAAVTTGERVYREDGALPGAILTRVASSHLRIGTLQYFYSHGDLESLATLVDYTLKRHYPQRSEEENPALSLLEAVIAKQAELIARWQGIGFIHGVMNTDNMLLCGETIDYGPCAFMDDYHPGRVFSYIDQRGRYAFGNQPAIANWNLAQLAQALLPLLDDDQARAAELAQTAIDQFPPLFFQAYHRIMAAKLGLCSFVDQDEKCYQAFLDLLESERCDFTLAFRKLADLADESSGADKIADLFEFSPAFDEWLEQWRQRLEQDPLSAAERQQQMYRANPVFIPRNHLVEQAIESAYQGDGYKRFEALNEVLSKPFDYNPSLKSYALPPTEKEQVKQTFCGT